MIINKVSLSGMVPIRAVIAVMIFSACLFAYMLRVNMSINLIAMVEPTVNIASGKINIPECLAIKHLNGSNQQESAVIPDFGQRYKWDPQVQGLILGSYFWGYILTSIPGGFLAERFGPTHVVAVQAIVTGILTILTPLAASVHYNLVIVIRFVIGLVGGVIYPSLHCLVSRWAPPEEKGKFTSALLGGTFGTVITWPILGAIIEQMGWVWAFYIPGGLCLVWVVIWYLLVTDRPQESKRISEQELKYIEKSLGDNITKTKRVPPYKNIFLSIPFWALAALHYGNLWGLFFLLTAGPKFMAEVLGFNLSNSGGLASLPYLARMTLGFVFGSIGDLIRRRNWLSVTAIRKWFTLLSHFIPGLLLLAQTITGCDVVWAVLLLTLSLGFNGASTVTNLQNSQDLAPNFAGSLYGIISCIGGTTGFITPILTGYLTKDHNGIAEWQIIFTIGASVYIASGIIFCLFGSGDMQPWNNNEPLEGPKEEENHGHVNKAFDDKTEEVKTNGVTDIKTLEDSEVTKV